MLHRVVIGYRESHTRAGARARSASARAGSGRRLRRALIAACLGALAGAATPDARAADGDGGAAQLFDAGIADLKAGKFDTACAALEQSYGLDANPGALIALADCLERWGKSHSAAVRYEQLVAAVARSADGAADSDRAPLLSYARQALARLAPKIPHLVLSRVETLPPDLVVSVDGERVALAAPEHDVTLDPGAHVVETQADGHDTWRVELALASGERRVLALELGPEQVPALAPAPSTSDAAPSPSEPALPGAESPARGSALLPEPPASPWRSVGWTLGAVGVAGVGVGAVAGIMMLETCSGFDCREQPERGKTLAHVTDIGLGVGLLSLAGAAYLLLRTDAPDPPPAAAQWQPVGGASARGGWLGMSHDW